MSEATKLEKHHTRYDMRPMKSFEYKGFKVAIAEGGPKYEYTSEVTREDCPHGYYDVIFTIIQNDKAIWEVPIYFDSLHDLDKEWTDDTRRLARLNHAEQSAKIHINDFLKASYAIKN